MAGRNAADESAKKSPPWAGVRFWTNRRGNKNTTDALWRVYPNGIAESILDWNYDVINFYRNGSPDSDDS